MSKLLTAVTIVLTFIKTLIRGRDTKLIDGAIEYPGHLNFANKGGEYFHGCKVKKFRTIRGMNEWFLPGNEGFLTLVAEILPVTGGYLVVYTRKLSNEDLEDVEEFNRNMNDYFSKQREKRNADKLKEKEQKLKDEQEEKRLAQVGRKYEARIAKIRTMDPSGLERKRAEKQLNQGVLDDDKGGDQV